MLPALGWNPAAGGDDSAIEAPAFSLHPWVIVRVSAWLGAGSEAYARLCVTPGSKAGHSGLK